MTQIVYLPASLRKSKAEIDRRLNRSARYRRCEEGNRNPFLNSRTYYAAIKSDDVAMAEAAALVRNAKGDRHITDKEIEYVIDKNNKLISRRWLVCAQEASRLLGKGWHVNAYIVMQQVLLYAFKTGLCSAAQGEIGKAVGLSRKAVNKWIKRFREAGLLTLIGYDCRGVVTNTWGKPVLWRGKPVMKYCLILAIAEPVRVSARGYTTPKEGGAGGGFSAVLTVILSIWYGLLDCLLSKIARARAILQPMRCR